MRHLLLPLYMILMAAPVLAQSMTFAERLVAAGFEAGGVTDWSDSAHVVLPQPQLAFVNLVMTEDVPAAERDTARAWVEYYDPVGQTYFRKRVRMHLQGHSSLSFEKRNFAIDVCEDQWLGEETTKVVFDGWVRQDGFHLKAFYIDWLRGVGAVGYQLYDEIERQMPEGQQRLWQRAGVEGHSKARCYPDAFPCALYVNGDFYGLYAWALRKHRRSMSMEKKNPLHIHLDGVLSEESLWGGEVDWTAFEVRNPKGLLTASGAPYDGDHPSALADGPVRDAIVALSHSVAELRAMEADGASRDEMRRELTRRFDVESLFNYVVFGQVVSNYDGFVKNWQWVTYDGGERWAVAPYDLDCTFGNFHGGTFTFPARLSYINSTYTMYKTRYGVVELLWEYFDEELIERYCQLRSAGVLDADHIIGMLYAWYERIGQELYDEEWARWPDSYCISQTIVADGWSMTEDWPLYYGLAPWSPTLRYYQGERVALDSRVWRATKQTLGVRPYIRMGYTDSLDRLSQWVIERLELEDSLFGYMPVSQQPTPDNNPRRKAVKPCGVDGIHHPDAETPLHIVDGVVTWRR